MRIMFHKMKYHIVNYLPALSSRNYQLYFFGQGISLIGTWMASVAEQWLIYPVLTNNRSLLGIISAINLLPTVALVLFAGVIADRVNRKKALILTQIAFMLIAFLLSYLVFSGFIKVWHVLLAALLSGTVFAFDMPIRQSFMVELVEKKDVASALSLNSGIFNAARALGPAAAGFLIASIGIGPAYVINGISFFAVIIGILLMTLPPHQKEIHPGYIEGFKEGFRYIKANKIVAVLFILIGLFTFSTWPAATLLPIFAHDIYKRGEMGFGMLQSFLGIGAVISALGFAKLYEKITNKFHLLIGSIVLAMVSVILFALSPWFEFALLFQLLSGLAGATLISTANTLVMTSVPTHLRGRLMSFYSFVLIGGMPPGALLASLGVATIGARGTILIMAIVFILASFFLITATKGKFQEKLNMLPS